MDRHQLTGRNLCRVFNFRSGRLRAVNFLCYGVKLPSLKLSNLECHFDGENDGENVIENVQDLSLHRPGYNFINGLPGKTNRRERLSTVDLLIKEAYFVQKR